MGDPLRSVLQELDLNGGNGLVGADNLSDVNTVQKSFFMRVHEKMGVDAVYFLRDGDGNARIPFIYFASMRQYDEGKNAELHRLSWNIGEAPLLFIVTPEKLLVYDNYIVPQENSEGKLDPGSGLLKELELINGVITQSNELKIYHRSSLESGEYWRRCEARKNRSRDNGRVDKTLLDNLKAMRRELIRQIKARGKWEDNAITCAVNALLCRSIFIKYMEEREGRNGRHVLEESYFAKFKDSARQYTDILEDKEATYRFFHELKDKFNGDILKDAEREQEIISKEDLELLRFFLTGNYEKDGQMVLWRLYSFDVIPIQLISRIYENFYHLSDGTEKRGTHYTPQHLVSFLMDEVYPWEGEYKELSFLDPSCGSGIFLVEAFQRIVCRWMCQNGRETATAEELGILLKKSIFGVDINGEALRVAAFSLYLSMCDFLDPADIWDTLTFPSLIGDNLLENDFFEEKDSLNKRKFDVIIGNPPWQSAITNAAKMYLEKANRVIGDKQIAQAFSIKCRELCKEDGLVCLVMPAKGLLFNTSELSKDYRRNLFGDNTVLEIINLALYKNVLFEHAGEPAAAVIYTPCKTDPDSPVIYCTPKPNYTFEDKRRFSVEAGDVCRIPRDAVLKDGIWKIAMVGGPRDFEIIEKMQGVPRRRATIDDYIEKYKMIAAEGFKRGNKKNHYNEFFGMPELKARQFPPYYIDRNSLNVVVDDGFERYAKKNMDIFYAPHLVMKQSPKDGRFLSAVLDYDAVFGHSFLGIHGDMEKLKYLSVMIGSDIFAYYHLLTSGRWMVERSEMEKGDITKTPMPDPNEEDVQEAARLFDESAKLGRKAPGTEEFVKRMYGINEYESRQIEDVIHCTYDALTRGKKSTAFQKPDTKEYRVYYDTIKDILDNSFGSDIELSGKLYAGGAPLSVMELGIGQGEPGGWKVIPDDDRITIQLSELDESLTDGNEMIYIKKNLRIYKSDAIYIIKPPQRKYWTYSAACRDGDEIFKDIANAWREVK